jgi:predicted HD phosphohydrolase
LSNASKETLKMQGGKMNLIETQFFENLPHYKEILLVRKMDDLAKDANIEFHPIEFYSTMLEEHLFNKLR